MNPTIRALGRRLRLGVVGGRPGSFIGPVHRTAARLDDRYELHAAVLSSNPERAEAADAIVTRRTGAPCDPLALDFPTVLDGAKGMKFIEAALESSRSGRWVSAELQL